MNESAEIDWSLCTPEGSHREQLRRWSALSLRRKLEALEEMCDLGRRTLASRRQRGLPYIDPYTGEAVLPPRPAGASGAGGSGAAE